MENRKIEGNYVVTEDERFSGMITGIVTVKRGVKFINHGMLCKDVIIEEGGFFYNHGMVNGNVIGEGYTEIWGMVKDHSLHQQKEQTCKFNKSARYLYLVTY